MIRYSVPMGEQQKFRTIKVVVERTYLVPVAKGEHTEINGWTIEEVVEDWFKNRSINFHHATRDSYHLGSGDKILAIEIEKKAQTQGELERGT